MFCLKSAQYAAHVGTSVLVSAQHCMVRVATAAQSLHHVMGSCECVGSLISLGGDPAGEQLGLMASFCSPFNKPLGRLPGWPSHPGLLPACFRAKPPHPRGTLHSEGRPGLAARLPPLARVSLLVPAQKEFAELRERARWPSKARIPALKKSFVCPTGPSLQIGVCWTRWEEVDREGL